MFRKNVGTIDRALRFVLGVVLLGSWVAFPDLAWRNWLLIGVIPLATSLLSSCPLYSILGLNTCPAKKG